MGASLLKRLFGRDPQPVAEAPQMCLVPVWRVIENNRVIREFRYEAGAVAYADDCRERGRRVQVRVSEREMPREQLAIEFREMLRERSTLRHQKF